jgi:hypothetical protein
MSFPKNKINLKVLLYALAQQVEPLPTDLQRSLTEIGQALQANPSDEDRVKIRELVAGYQPLEIVYRDALTKWNQNYVSQERTKSLGATFPMMSGVDEVSILQGRGFAIESCLLPANDWVLAAKQLVNNISSPPTPAKFWDKTDRMAVTTAGGIAIGSAIAQLPGAIVGGVLGAGYGWYLGFRKPTDRTSGLDRIETDNNNPNLESFVMQQININGGSIEVIEVNDPNLAIDFGDLSTEQLAMMAQSATQDAVKDLHHKSISTYGLQDGILYETNPVNNTRSVVEEHHQS